MYYDLLSMNYDELTSFVLSIGEKQFRAKQISEWIRQGKSIAEMSNLSHDLRKKLELQATLYYPKIIKKLCSSVDETVKYLFELKDGESVESVVMKYKYGYTICVSSQVGCRMGCKFCASTLGGLVRNLAPGELLGQIISAQNDLGIRISGIVMMGIGEPLDNYDNVIKFIKIVSSKESLNIGCRHISLSTCGVVDKIYKLSKECLPITLSISLHAPNDVVRSRIMPINNKWCISELLGACKDYFKETGRRISFEYTLIYGENDSVENAKELAETLYKYLGKEIPFHVNLIPLNEVFERKLSTSPKQNVEKYKNTLVKLGINATVRRHLGGDINASCGQLRRGEKLSVAGER